ncbi:MAG TPA: dynamin family protein [Candidatus Hydrogenedentes bacterium]|nr:dynamin family protein [Candidatus Hydrogenedentota bacterium]
MKFYKQHEEHRTWVLTALDRLLGFVRTDPDFRADRAHEEETIASQRKSVEEGKYRIVFLGAFNVGKSTAINAFLGGAYLPMDVEECTSKLTYIERGDRMDLRLKLGAHVTEEELATLRTVYDDLPARVSHAEGAPGIVIAFDSDAPAFMRRALAPLVTVMADEEFPRLASLREKIEELRLALPSAVIEQDIAFVDTPGVHSISMSRQEISYNIIERSHLVICFVDSGLVGNIHDLNFIKRIIKWRGRRVFFVLNKADKLERDEIDVRGVRGPAKALIQTFKRHEIPEDSDIFFLSGYRALRAQELEHGHVTLEDLLEDNKLSVPTSVRERLEESDAPKAELVNYLLVQSRLPSLKERLLDYLLFENKEGAVVESACKFLCERADRFLAPLDMEIRLAEHPAEFDELRANRESLIESLNRVRAQAERTLNEYNARSKGGRVGDEAFAGYEAQFRKGMCDEAIEEHILVPIYRWLRDGANLRAARQSNFATLSLQVEHQVDEFVSRIMAEMNASIEQAESMARQAIAEQLMQVRGIRMHMASPAGIHIHGIEASMTSSYAAFSASGALVGAAAGATIGSVFPGIGTAIGAGLGALAGVVGGFLTRLAWGDEKWRRKIMPVVRENVMNMLVHGGKDADGGRTTPIMEIVIDYLNRRANEFYKAVQSEVDNAISQVQRECDDLLAREEEIRRECDAILARLRPKAALLDEVRERAAEIIRQTAERDAERV